MFKNLFGRKATRDNAETLFAAIVERTRTPLFYQFFEAEDTVEGRFELLTLHAFLVLRRLKREGEASGDLAQATFDVMFENVDLNLREVGVGDIGLARRIKKMVEGFYGRVDAYDQALEFREESALQAALRRNLFNTKDPSNETLKAMADYVVRCDSHLANLSVKTLVSGEALFAELPALAD